MVQADTVALELVQALDLEQLLGIHEERAVQLVLELVGL